MPPESVANTVRSLFLFQNANIWIFEKSINRVFIMILCFILDTELMRIRRAQEGVEYLKLFSSESFAFISL
jgi:hypothetical protein